MMCSKRTFLLMGGALVMVFYFLPASPRAATTDPSERPRVTLESPRHGDLQPPRGQDSERPRGQDPGAPRNPS
jgi:hypothetical protein